jgi:hypothetical protein
MNRMFVSPQGEFLTLLERRISWIEIDSHGIFFGGAGIYEGEERQNALLAFGWDDQTLRFTQLVRYQYLRSAGKKALEDRVPVVFSKHEAAV